MDVHDLGRRRRRYDADSLPDGAFDDPFELFEAWLLDATRAQDEGRLFEATAMNVATAARLPDGSWQPRVRTVLLKAWSRTGFRFFTNYGSDKGRELDANPRAELHIHWPELERQVRISGPVTRVPRPDSEAYFAIRPRAAQLGAWASAQSRPVASQSALAEQYELAEARFEGLDVPCPPGWGGYEVAPERLEFWQGRPSRLHDRIVFTPAGEGWQAIRLQP